jgi:hypothetical protein
MKSSTLAARALAAQRRSFGGPAKVLAPCKHCGVQFSARALRAHLPICSRNPRNAK